MQNKEKSKDQKRIIDSYDYLANSASANDCTGLIPSAPQSRAELESYEEVYAFVPPEVPKKETEKKSG